MSRKTAALISILSIAVLIVTVNMLGGLVFRSAQLDLTERQLYTLSKGTKAITRTLEEPIELRYYFSETLATDYAQLHSYGLRIRDLLQRIAAGSRGQLKVQIIDPEPFSPEEDEAAAFGLTGAQLDSGEKLFMGLVGTNQVDGIETVPFFSPDREQYLEYDIARLISTLETPDKPVVGILSSLPLETGTGGMAAMMQGGGQPYVIYEQMKASYDLQTFDAGVRTIPDTVKVLMIAHPPALGAAALYAIDQFVMRGGHLLVLVDPFLESASGPGGQTMPGMQAQSDIEPLLAHWGVKFDAGQIVLDKDRATPVQAAGSQILPYLPWLRLTTAEINRDDLVSADIDLVQMGSAGPLKPLPDAATRFTPLLTSTANSSLMSAMILRYGADPATLLDDFTPDAETYTLAARVSGPVTSVYPGGAPKDETAEKQAEETGEAEQPLPPHLSEAMAPLEMILISDADMLEDRFWVQTQNFLGQRIAQPNAGNGFFIMNALENLLGSDELISLRSRQQSARPFEKVDALEKTAQAQYRQEEQRLERQIADTESRLAALQSNRPEGDMLVDPQNGTALLTPEQRAEMRSFQTQLAASRRALRQVQRDLRSDVIALGGRIKFINVALMPLLVALGALGLSAWRRRRRAQRHRDQAQGGAA